MSSVQHLSSLKQLSDLARHWDYECEIVAAEKSPTHEVALEGTLRAVTLPYGIDLCLNDITTREEDYRSATLKQCLTILLTLDGDTPNYYLDDGRMLVMELGVAKVIATCSPLRLWCRNPSGHHSRSLVIQAAPRRIVDGELAQQIERLLQHEGIYSFMVPHHTLTLADSLFTLCDSCVPGRLHIHSCVLDLLAQGLRAVEQTPSLMPYTAPCRDTVRILKVRDKLLAQLDNNHCLYDLAREAGISISALKSKFTAVMGQSVFSFLREQRLMRARKGLESEGWTVKQAAYYVGYQHPSNFSTAYRRKFGRCPRDALNA
ncbi:helix-turn-helix transcriptional regulator [Symbiopectobacterium sp.]|uniref:helix-turn-helix transcriptional regulator n=1 Tax=Symbiopectobacterium sp. TaxID=2952789 RepID=UPI003F2D79E7